METTTIAAPAAAFHPGIAGHPSVHPTARRRQAAGRVDLAALAKREAVPMTLRELAEAYTRAHPDKAVSVLAARKWLVDFGLGDRLAWSITREEIEAGAQYMRSPELGYGIASVNRNLSLIGSLYRHAVAMKLAPAKFESPTLRIERAEEVARYVEPARPGEWEHIRGLARGRDPKFTLFVWLVMDTGCRRAEIRDRTWREFEIDDTSAAPCLVLPAHVTKTKRARRVYFSHETAALLRKIRPADKYRDALVFTSPRSIDRPNEYRKPWARLAARSGRPDLHLHDLRHMVAAQMLKDGHGVAQVAHALGNSVKVLEKRYGHLDDAATRALQTKRLGLDEHQPALELEAVVEARQRQAERDAAAPDEKAREVDRLRLLVADAMAALATLQGGK